MIDSRSSHSQRSSRPKFRKAPHGRSAIQRTLKEHSIEHYHVERNDQRLDNAIPFPPKACGRIRQRERLGGLLKFHDHAV